MSTTISPQPEVLTVGSLFPTVDCGECGVAIPTTEPAVNRLHAESCSLFDLEAQIAVEVAQAFDRARRSRARFAPRDSLPLRGGA